MVKWSSASFHTDERYMATPVSILLSPSANAMMARLRTWVPSCAEIAFVMRSSSGRGRANVGGKKAGESSSPSASSMYREARYKMVEYRYDDDARTASCDTSFGSKFIPHGLRCSK